MYTIGNYYSIQMNVCCLGWIGTAIPIHPRKYIYLKKIKSTNCYMLMIVPPDDGPRYARNMYPGVDKSLARPGRTQL